MSTEVTTQLKWNGIKLSKHDIILLDFSVNDSANRLDHQGAGLDLLIREIYRQCHNFDPTIIIVEQYYD